MTQISKTHGNTQQSSLHENLKNEKKIAKEVSDILKKNKENKNILLPKLSNPSKRSEKTEKHVSFKKEKSTMRLTDRVDEIKKLNFKSKDK